MSLQNVQGRTLEVRQVSLTFEPGIHCHLCTHSNSGCRCVPCDVSSSHANGSYIDSDMCGTIGALDLDWMPIAPLKKRFSEVQCAFLDGYCRYMCIRGMKHIGMNMHACITRVSVCPTKTSKTWCHPSLDSEVSWFVRYGYNRRAQDQRRQGIPG